MIQGQYQESEASPTFPILTKAMIDDFLEQCKSQGETQAKRYVRLLIQEQQG